MFAVHIAIRERKTQMNTRRFVRNWVWPFIILVTLLLIAWGSIRWGIPPVQAATQVKKSLPVVQMVHGMFADQNLPEDGSTVTLVSIPFTTTATASLEVTSLIDAQFGGGGCCGQGGTVVTETCSVMLDSVSLFSTTWASNATLPASLSMTTTTNAIAPGSHVLSVQCTGSTNTGQPGETVLARSGGTSAIIVS